MEYSPVLAMATAAFEIVVAGWALAMRGEPGARGVLQTTSAILLLLAGYQIAEVAICADVAAAGFLPRLAFIIVTWLPPLGLVLIAQLRRPRSTSLVATASAMLAAAAGIVVWIAVDRSFASASVCTAVYARYSHAMPGFRIYAWFYWIGLAAMVVASGYGMATCTDSHRRRQLRFVLIGTLAFVVPGLTLSWVVPPARGALPSILCHLALLLAICLAWLIRLEAKVCKTASGTAATQAG